MTKRLLERRQYQVQRPTAVKERLEPSLQLSPPTPSNMTPSNDSQCTPTLMMSLQVNVSKTHSPLGATLSCPSSQRSAKSEYLTSMAREHLAATWPLNGQHMTYGVCSILHSDTTNGLFIHGHYVNFYLSTDEEEGNGTVFDDQTWEQM